MDNHNKPQSPLCTTCKPNIFTNKNINLCTEVLTTEVPTYPKPRSPGSKRDLLTWTLHLCIDFSDSIQYHCFSFFHSYHLVPNLTEGLLGGKLMSDVKCWEVVCPCIKERNPNFLPVIWRFGGFDERILLPSVRKYEALMVTNFHRDRPSSVH